MAQVKGTPNDDTIRVGAASVGVEPATGATSENDTIAGLGGADTLAGGAGNDDFQFDPSNPTEGRDVIQDFTIQSVTDSSKLDYVAFQSAQVLAADPGLPGADGDATGLSLVDFDASLNWNLSSSPIGSLLIEHPGGSIEFAGIPSNAITSFNDLAPSLKVDGKIWAGPINLTPRPAPADFPAPSAPPLAPADFPADVASPAVVAPPLAPADFPAPSAPPLAPADFPADVASPAVVAPPLAPADFPAPATPSLAPADFPPQLDISPAEGDSLLI